jgi:hypothetical protein
MAPIVTKPIPAAGARESSRICEEIPRRVRCILAAALARGGLPFGDASVEPHVTQVTGRNCGEIVASVTGGVAPGEVAGGSEVTRSEACVRLSFGPAPSHTPARVPNDNMIAWEAGAGPKLSRYQACPVTACGGMCLYTQLILLYVIHVVTISARNGVFSPADDSRR